VTWLDDYRAILEKLSGGDHNVVTVITPRCYGKNTLLSHYMEKLMSDGIIDRSKVITIKHLPCDKDLSDSFIPPMAIKPI